MTEKGSVITPDAALPSATANDVPSRSISRLEALDYLKRNPDLIADHPELLEPLADRKGARTPAHDDGGVIDIQTLILQRLRDENRKLRDAWAAVATTARDNRSNSNQIHAAVLQLMAAGSFETLIHTVTADLPITLGVDVVVICLEAGDVRIPRAYASGLRSLPEGAVDRYIGPGRGIVLSCDVAEDAPLFGEAAGLVRSHALARLNISAQAPKGLLALGSRNLDMFDQSQGGELIAFLSETLEVMIRQWLNLKA